MSSSERDTHSRNVDPDKLAKLNRKAINLEANKVIPWPTPKDCVRLVRYIKFDNSSGIVYLDLNRPVPRENVLFYVQHDPEDSDHIFVKPATGLVPCGWFTLDWLQAQVASSGLVMEGG